MPIASIEPLQPNKRSATMANEPITDPELENLIRRIRGLEAGRRYLITLSKTGAKVDYTVLDLGKVER